MTRRAMLAVSVAAGVLSVVIAVSGGLVLSAGGVRVSARSWTPPAVAALALGAVWIWFATRARALSTDLGALTDVFDKRGRGAALIAASIALLGALVFGTYSAAGADASGYLSQAEMWSGLDTRLADPLVTLPDWPLTPGDTAPLGWRPALERGWQVPTYAPGLPWLMAVPHLLFGTAGAVWVVALSAGVAVWATGALAWRLGGGVAAIIASMLVATSPTFLYQSFQPMSDVPVTAAWIACWRLATAGAPALAGSSAAVAVLIRPNLAPLAAVPWVVVVLLAPSTALLRRATRFAVPVALAGSAIAVLQWKWYGSPLTSGYGSAGDLFVISNVGPNAWLYLAWLWEAESAFVVMAALGLGCLAWAAAARDLRPPGTWWIEIGLLCFAAGATLAYLVYAIFEVWSYVRFLLPGMAVAAVLAGAALARVIRRLPTPAQGAIALVLTVASAAWGVHTARTLGVFRVAAVTARAREAGAQLARRLPTRAVLLTGEQSGSMRYATRRPIVRWEALDGATLGAALATLARNGYDAWWVLDQFEESHVRARFPGVPEAALDWPPEVEAGPLMRIRAWRIRSASGREAP